MIGKGASVESLFKTIAAGLSLSVLAAPALAAEPVLTVSVSPPDLAGLTDAALDAKIEQTRQMQRGNLSESCTMAMLLLEHNRRNPDALTLGHAEYNAAFCALNRNDIPGAWDHIAKAEAQMPVTDGGQLRIAVDVLALDLAAGTGKPNSYADHAVHIGQIYDPDLLALMNGEALFANLSKADGVRRDAAYLALARSVGFARLPDYFRQAIAETAIGPALEAGDRELALRLLDVNSDPDHFFPILIDRRYASIWPEAVRRAGPRMRQVNADFLAIARAEYAAEPDNRWAFDDLIRALVIGGHNSEAIDLIATMPRDPASVARYEAGDAWALNAAATAFDREGRRDEADAAFELIARIPPEDRPWLTTMLNNRTGRLADQGRWGEAWSAGLYGLEVAEQSGNSYPLAVAAAYLLCIAPNVSDAPNARRASAIIDAQAAENPFPAAFAAYCQGNRDKARDLVIKTLRDDDNRQTALHGLQPPGASKLGSDAPSALPDLSEFVRTDAALATELAKYGRQLPTDLFYPRTDK